MGHWCSSEARRVDAGWSRVHPGTQRFGTSLASIDADCQMILKSIPYNLVSHG